MPGQKRQLYGRNDGLGRNGGGHYPDRGSARGARRTHLGYCIASCHKEQSIWLKHNSFAFPCSFQMMPSCMLDRDTHRRKEMDMDLPTDSIAGPVYPYDTQAIPTLPGLHCTARIHLLVVSSIRPCPIILLETLKLPASRRAAPPASCRSCRGRLSAARGSRT